MEKPGEIEHRRRYLSSSVVHFTLRKSTPCPRIWQWRDGEGKVLRTVMFVRKNRSPRTNRETRGLARGYGEGRNLNDDSSRSRHAIRRHTIRGGPTWGGGVVGSCYKRCIAYCLPRPLFYSHVVGDSGRDPQ